MLIMPRKLIFLVGVVRKISVVVAIKIFSVMPSGLPSGTSLKEVFWDHSEEKKKKSKFVLAALQITICTNVEESQASSYLL